MKVFSKMFYPIPYHSLLSYSFIFSCPVIFYWPLWPQLNSCCFLPLFRTFIPSYSSQFSPLAPPFPQHSPSGSRGVGVRPLRFCWFGGLGSMELVGSRFRSRATKSADLRRWTPSMGCGDSGSGQSVSQNLSQQES